MNAPITKRTLLAAQHKGQPLFKNDAAISRTLGVAKSTVTRWPLDNPIPELYELRLRYRLMPRVKWDV